MAASKASLPERVAQLYYALGLLCSSYPASIMTVAVSVVLACCWPLAHLPLPGAVPLQVAGAPGANGSEPWCYVQQVVVRAAVVPWAADLALADAFRAPLHEAFKLLEVVRNYEHAAAGTLAHVCLHVEAVKRAEGASDAAVLPQYSCLLLSPANVWHQDVTRFSQDAHLLATIFSLQDMQKGKPSLAELLFGMSLKEAGVKRYPLRSRQRVLQFALTLVFKRYDKQFVAGLRHKLETLYPLHQSPGNESTAPTDEMLYIYYPGVFNYVELAPLAVTFLALFFYMYFSVRKIELIRSKVGMALAAVVTVLGSLAMSVGLCFFFGLTLSMQAKEIFPYLVIMVGLENVLVLTKSVVSTPQHLDVKIRIAQGLSREGWSITKNILVEITILTIGLATFVPVIQEFCVFAITGLISDFFLQMFFFSTILGMDIRRMEETHAAAAGYRHALYAPPRGLARSKSHPRLTGTHAAAPAAPPERRIPKRLRLVNIWARTRLFQRAFMVWMVVWISIIVYNSDVLRATLPVELAPPPVHVANTSNHNTSTSSAPAIVAAVTTPAPPPARSYVNYVTPSAADELARLRHPEAAAPWPRLPARHWPAVLARYNVSLGGRRIAVLPCIRVSVAVRPEQAARLRHADEARPPHAFQWHALAAALDPLDLPDSGAPKRPPGADQPLYPNSPMEILLATILCAISVLVLAYATVVLYRCVCTRNYAEWRASWASERADEPVAQLVMEAVPLVLDGHCQEVECLATDGSSVVSSCLGGQLKVWDAATGEQLASIDRRLHPGAAALPEAAAERDDSLLSDYESGSPPSRDEPSLPPPPGLQRRINTNFGGLRLEPLVTNRSFDFGEHYRQLYAAPSEAVGSARAPWPAAGGAHVPPIWCIDYLDNLIVLGCANGRLEFWEGTTGKLKCIFEDGSDVGVTALKLIGNRVVAARLNGSLDFMQLQSYNQGRQIDWGFTSAYRRTHVRTGSTGSIVELEASGGGDPEDLRCLRLGTARAHQQPVSALDSEGGRVVSGGQDHTVRVHRLEDAAPLLTLHGHCGPVTCLFIDRVSPLTAGSGSQDGLLCVWDLATGACVYSVQAHDGRVASLAYSASYVISLGADDKLCVWERFQGHLLNSIHVGPTCACRVLMLTHSLLVTARQGSLVVLDARTGDTVRVVPLGHRDACVFVKQPLLLRDAAVVCDYGSQLRIVRFPLITHKYE